MSGTHSSFRSRKVLVLGSGGREHALVWQLNKTGAVVECSPGNDAINRLVPTWNFSSFDDLREEIERRGIEEVIVGPEKYLAEGISDELVPKGVSVFGPSKSAARLETDKTFAKNFLTKHEIPTARSESVTNENDLRSAIQKFRAPYVVKAAGLAAGKGVWIGDSSFEAERMGALYLKEHSSVVIEEFLAGEEISYFVLVEGSRSLFLGAAQDHKRLLDNDEGPNTGGMGAYSPVPLLTSELQSKIEREIVQKTLKGLEADQLYYRGFLFIGLMIVDGEPYVLEFNCRMGDPETQAIMRRLKTPLDHLIQSLQQKDSNLAPEFEEGVSLNLVLAARGYPESPLKGFQLTGLETAPGELEIFHAGSVWKDSEKAWIARGGRVLGICTLQPNLLEAQKAVYSWVESLTFLDKISFRRDIGVKAYRHLFSKSPRSDKGDHEMQSFTA